MAPTKQGERQQVKSWKTTIAGAIAALGVYLTGIENPEPAWLGTVGEIMGAAGALLVGLWARDNDKSSEAVGAGAE